uniref:Uncharacterized protein n=1 Tax=Manihot esculenta TaxID=3983 RepID=A0A2C9VJK1_MANES
MLKQLWDELNAIKILPPCTCGVSKIAEGMYNRHRVMQVLMGLNDAYEPVRDQVLMMDPLPSVSRPYLMVMKFEAQKKVLSTFSEDSESIAFFNKIQPQYQKNRKENMRFDSKKSHFTHCNISGHTRKGYFKLIGYPD